MSEQKDAAKDGKHWDVAAEMSLRDYFAAAALQGLLAQTPVKVSAAEMARESYVCADAMLAERAKAQAVKE